MIKQPFYYYFNPVSMLLILTCILKGHFMPLNVTQIYTFDQKSSILSVSSTSGFSLLGALKFMVETKKNETDKYVCLVPLRAQWFSKTCLWKSNASITQELIRNAQLQPCLRSTESEILGMEAKNKTSRQFCYRRKCENTHPQVLNYLN